MESSSATSFSINHKQMERIPFLPIFAPQEPRPPKKYRSFNIVDLLDENLPPISEPSPEPSPKRGPRRIHPSIKQKEILFSKFIQKVRPSTEELEELAGQTGLKIDRLKLWFRKQRAMRGMNIKGFPDHQSAVLKNRYLKNERPDKLEICEIAKESGLTSKNVFDWFRNRRANERRKIKSKLVVEN